VNYLALVNRTKLESGRSGGDLATVVGATGDNRLLCSLVAESWLKVQRISQEWAWMRSSVLASITASQITQDPAVDMTIQPDDMVPVLDFRAFFPETEDYQMTLLDPATPAGESVLVFLEYPDFRARYIVGVHEEGRPRFWSISPDNKLMLGPTPDMVYHVRFDYRTTQTTLAVDADTPDMPVDFHMAIVWGALMSLAAYDNSPEVYTRSRAEYREVIAYLHQDQGPKWFIGQHPLA
jgi:hypothetical protein